jgi:Holliday junction resolvase RusA-like endonuclease
MNELRFFVSGKPAPGGSKKVFPIRKAGVLTGKFVVTDAGGMANKNWRANVAHAGAQAMKERGLRPGVCALELELIFHLPRPKSHFLSKSVIQLRAGAPMFPITRPDVGKLARSTQDALTGIVWRDDAQVVKETHEKVYSDQPGCWIVIREAGK